MGLDDVGQLNYPNYIMYIPLWVHSEYSLLGSTIRIKSLIDKVVELGLSTVALTDYHNLFGAMEFCLACKKKSIKPIVGCRLQMHDGNELLLYCKDEIGYENLSLLISDSYLLEKTHAVRWEALQKHSAGLLCIAAPGAMKNQELENLAEVASKLEGCLEWYVGVEPNNRFFAESAYMSQLHQTSVVAVSEVYFLNPEDQEAHDILLCIRNKSYVSEDNRVRSDERFCMPNEIELKFKNLEFAVENTQIIADRCNFILEETSPKLPSFEVNSDNISDHNNPNEAEIRELTRMSNCGLAEMSIKPEELEEYQKRLDFELEIINNMGFPGYFLIVSDFIAYARSQNIPLSLRGSGAGSLVARCIGITDIDPIKFELFFERFLNPGRLSMPDFDIDFSPVGRGKTIDYVLQKYGVQCVAGIITFGSLSSRMVLKDVGRVLQVPYGQIDNLCKKIQHLFGRQYTLQETYEQDAEFAKEIDSSPTLRRVFEIGRQLEGLNRHVSAHAAGIIITDRPIYKVAPLYKDAHSDLPLVQFSMKYAEAAGLVKFDFLGVTALDIIAQTVGMIHENGHEITLSNDDFSDKKAFELLRSGFTRGIFQFETSGMTKLIHDMDADCIEDLIATVSLYRPGPMDNIPMFIRCKKGQEKIHYIYPALQSILANTYGIIVYQEQILRIVREIAGYSLAEADLLRRAIGKKILSEMEKCKEDFVTRAHKIQGGDVKKAVELFKLIETFANYGFNKAHAAAYAIVGYKGAYLKTYYPLYFACVSMTAEIHNTEKLVELILEAKKMKMEVFPPDINQSEIKFSIKGDKIVYSLAAIKNIGEHLASQIINARPFSSLEDLLDKVNLNKREVESLIKSGALDCFWINRGILHSTYNLISRGDQNSFLFAPEIFIDDSHEWNEDQCLQYEYEVLGMYISGHPLNQYSPKNLGAKSIAGLDLQVNADRLENASILQSYVQKFGKRNNKYYLCTFFDLDGMWTGMVLDENLFSALPILKGSAVWCTAQIRNGRIIVNSLCPISQKIKLFRDLHVRLDNDDLHNLQEALKPFKTHEGVGVYLHTDEVRFMGCVPSLAVIMDKLGGYNWVAK